MPPVLYLADRGSTAFEAGHKSVGVVCAGDSITYLLQLRLCF